MRFRTSAVPSLCAVLLVACSSRGERSADTAATREAAGGALVVREGFSGPEAVRYDPDQDMYFVSNFGEGDATTLDDNGFISRMRPDGSVENLRFIAGGTGGVRLHAPRGMTIVGDTLWVADADAVRGFHRRTGAPLASADFSKMDVGFLNDVAAGDDGALYVTDTGRDRIYAVRGPAIALADSALGGPNGITWDAANRRFIVVPYGRGNTIRAWTPGGALTDIGSSAGGKFDGIEVLSGGRVLVASQADTSLHIFVDARGTPVIHTGGPPADIAVDTRRNRVAVPIIALDRVEIWELPR